MIVYFRPGMSCAVITGVWGELNPIEVLSGWLGCRPSGDHHSFGCDGEKIRR